MNQAACIILSVAATVAPVAVEINPTPVYSCWCKGEPAKLGLYIDASVPPHAAKVILDAARVYRQIGVVVWTDGEPGAPRTVHIDMKKQYDLIPRALAIAHYPSTPEPYAGDITIFSWWLERGYDPAYLRTVVLHELGHVFGLGHNLDTPYSVMTPYLWRPWYVLPAADIEALSACYPVQKPRAAHGYNVGRSRGYARTH